MKAETDQSQKIPCKICGQLFHVITWMHLLFRHRMSVQTYMGQYGGPIMSEAHKEKAYRYHSVTMKRLYFEGEVNPPISTPEFRSKLSQRMLTDNPMKDRKTARKSGKARRGVTEQELLERRLQREREKEEARVNRAEAGVKKYHRG